MRCCALCVLVDEIRADSTKATGYHAAVLESQHLSISVACLYVGWMIAPAVVSLVVDDS